jgi:hypothetical protein
MFLESSLPADEPPVFRQSDDDRLRAIMEAFPGRLSQVKWRLVASCFGGGLSVRQIQERWYNFARPGLDRSIFTTSERRQVAELAIDRPGDYRWIASQLGNGQNRSSTMVKHCAMNILPKLKSLGFEIESSMDIALVPDFVFERGKPTGNVLDALLAEYRDKKAKRAADVEAQRRRYVPTLALTIEDLLAKQPKK